MARAQLHAPVNFYLYDGEHSHESQRKALTHFYPMLDDVFIFVVDDYTWETARSGTQEGIGELGLDDPLPAGAGRRMVERPVRQRAEEVSAAPGGQRGR